LDEIKQKYANAKTEITLEQAMKDADVFIGLRRAMLSLLKW
jgi:hypothetical protein